VLLIIFMVITPMLQKGVPVNLAKTDNPVKMPEADKEDSLIVAVMRDGTIYFNSDKVTPEQLTDKVKDRLGSRPDKRIFVKADAGAKYGDVVGVVDDVRSAGVDQLGLMTDERKSGKLEPGQ
jgi:biopolymer transport protein ExbD/biopolymer transport protein TolR